MKMVINSDYGGFGISEALVKRAREEGVKWAQYPNTVIKNAIL